MEINIINLKKSTNKREQVLKLFKDADIEVSIFDAVNGKELPTNEISVFKDWYDPWHHRHMTYGEVGCAKSHIQLWKKLIDDCESGENTNNCMLILEDDVVIENIDTLKDLLAIKNPEFEFLYLGRKKISNNDELETDILKDYTYHTTVNAQFSYWTCGYIISLEGAKRLYSDWYINNIFPVDEYIPWMYGQKSLDWLEDKEACRENIMLSLTPNVIKPNNNAFNNSSTFFSKPVFNFRKDVKLVSVASENNDATLRYTRSCNNYGFEPILLGLDKPWNGSDMKSTGGGQKINLLREYLQTLEGNHLIVFTDSYDVICNNNVSILLKNYNKYYANKIVFGTERYCWPEKNLSDIYPEVDYTNKYLNSGNFIGWKDDILDILKLDIKDGDDDQLYYTKQYLKSLHEKRNIVLDYENRLFICLNGETNYKMDFSKSCLISKRNVSASSVSIIFNKLILLVA